MNRLKIIVFVLLYWLTLGATSSMGDEAQLKTVLFFVGNEIYADDDMNKLKYQAEDAVRLWKKFIELNDVDVGRSKLLISDDPLRYSGDELLSKEELKLFKESCVIKRSEGFSKFEIGSEFENFLTKVEEDDLVIIYLGGHGEKIGDQLCYCSSNFSKNPGVVTGEIRPANWIKEKLSPLLATKQNLHVVLLLNMCHAGALREGFQGNDSISDQSVSTAFQSLKAGIPNGIAVIPACAGRHRTYEFREPNEPNSSVFAHFLLNALNGGARSDVSDDLVSAGQVLSAMQGMYDQYELEFGPPDLLPDEIVPVFRSWKREAQERECFGSAALAAAIDLYNEGSDESFVYLLGNLVKGQFELAYKLNRNVESLLPQYHCHFLMNESNNSIDMTSDERRMYLYEERRLANELVSAKSSLKQGNLKELLESFDSERTKWRKSETKDRKFIIVDIPFNVSVDDFSRYIHQVSGNASRYNEYRLSLIQDSFMGMAGYSGLVGFSSDGVRPYFKESGRWIEFVGNKSQGGFHKPSFEVGVRPDFEVAMIRLRDYLEKVQSTVKPEETAIDLFVVAGISLNRKHDCRLLWDVLQDWRIGNVIVDGTKACVFKQNMETSSVRRFADVVKQQHANVAGEFLRCAVEPDFPLGFLRWNIPCRVDGWAAYNPDHEKRKIPGLNEAPLVWGSPRVFQQQFGSKEKELSKELVDRLRRHKPFSAKYLDAVSEIVSKVKWDTPRRLVFEDDQVEGNFLSKPIKEAPEFPWNQLAIEKPMNPYSIDQQVFNILSDAATSELELDQSKAIQQYESFLDSVDGSIEELGETSNEKMLAMYLGKLKSKIVRHLKQVKIRTESWQPKIHFCPIVPTDYESPVFPDCAPVLEVEEIRSAIAGLNNLPDYSARSRRYDIVDSWARFSSDSRVYVENCEEVIEKTLKVAKPYDLAVFFLKGYVHSDSEYRLIVEDSRFQNDKVLNSISIDRLFEQFAESKVRTFVVVECLVPETEQLSEIAFVASNVQNRPNFISKSAYLDTSSCVSVFFFDGSKAMIESQLERDEDFIKALGEPVVEHAHRWHSRSTSKIDFSRQFQTTSKLRIGEANSVFSGDRPFFSQTEKNSIGFESSAFKPALEALNGRFRKIGNVNVAIDIFAKNKELFGRIEDKLLLLFLVIRQHQLQANEHEYQNVLFDIDPFELESNLIAPYLRLLLLFHEYESIAASDCLERLETIVSRSSEDGVRAELQKTHVKHSMKRIVANAVNADRDKIIDRFIDLTTGDGVSALYEPDDSVIKEVLELRSRPNLRQVGAQR